MKCRGENTHPKKNVPTLLKWKHWPLAFSRPSQHKVRKTANRCDDKTKRKHRRDNYSVRVNPARGHVSQQRLEAAPQTQTEVSFTENKLCD